MKLKHNFRKYLRVSLKLITIYLFGRQKFLKKSATWRAKTLWLKGKKFFTIFSFFSGLFCRVFLYSCLPHQPRLYLYTVFFSSAGQMHSMQSGWMRPTTFCAVPYASLQAFLRVFSKTSAKLFCRPFCPLIESAANPMKPLIFCWKVRQAIEPWKFTVGYGQKLRV